MGERRLSLTERIWFRLRNFEHRPAPVPLRRAALKYVLPDPYIQSSMPQAGQREVIFVHVPKTGGTSLAKALGMESAHVPVSRFVVADPARFAAAFSFAFVRNPWDRLFSSFNYLHTSRGLNASQDVRWSEDNLAEFEDFEDFVLALKNARLRRRIWRWPHFRPQADWLCLPGQDRPMVSFVGRFETLSEDATRLSEEIGVPLELPHERKAQTYLKKRFTPEMISIIGELYRKDVAIFDHRPPG